MCNILGQFVDITSGPRSSEKNYPPNYPIWAGLNLKKFCQINSNIWILVCLPEEHQIFELFS
jgi:hypothetical protein